jgi:hypothetical protein
MTNRREHRAQEFEAVVAVEVWVDDDAAPARDVAAGQATAPTVEAGGPVVLSASEAALVGRILRSYLGDLRMEIADTDNPAMRRDLHAEEDAIRDLIGRLPAS